MGCKSGRRETARVAGWISKIDHVSGTPGTIGAVSNVYFETNGEIMSIQETITDIVSGESMSMTYTSDFMDMDYKITMTSLDGNTKISSSTVATGNGLISKSMMALIGKSIKKQEETNLHSLKKTIERNTKDYFD